MAALDAGISGGNVTLVSWFAKNNGDGVVGRAYLGSLCRGNNIHVVEEIRSKRGTAYVSSNCVILHRIIAWNYDHSFLFQFRMSTFHFR